MGNADFVLQVSIGRYRRTIYQLLQELSSEKTRKRYGLFID